MQGRHLKKVSHWDGVLKGWSPSYSAWVTLSSESGFTGQWAPDIILWLQDTLQSSNLGVLWPPLRLGAQLHCSRRHRSIEPQLALGEEASLGVTTVWAQRRGEACTMWSLSRVVALMPASRMPFPVQSSLGLAGLPPVLCLENLGK